MLKEFLIKSSADAPISISEYLRICLYHPECGYYIRKKQRVGRWGDFYTSSSLKGGVFSALLLASAKKLANADLEIVEIGAEPERTLFDSGKVIRIGDELSLCGNIFLFSNELLDASPFDRFKFENGKIQKTFVRFNADGSYALSYKDADADEASRLEKYFSFKHEIFYLDFSFAALDLFKGICSQNWNGALIFADYFRTRAELADFPAGTARMYKRHAASANIFDAPGEADITFSPPFEDFAEILEDSGFKNVSCDTQAKFFFSNAQDAVKRIVESAETLSDEKRALSELMSPVHLGDNFRVLAGVR